MAEMNLKVTALILTSAVTALKLVPACHSSSEINSTFVLTFFFKARDFHKYPERPEITELVYKTYFKVMCNVILKE